MRRMAKGLMRAQSEFDRAVFLKDAQSILSLEMKDRVRFIRDRLRASLPQKYSYALKLLMKYLIADSSGLSGFKLWPVSEFIQTFGPIDAEPISNQRSPDETTKLLTNTPLTEMLPTKKHPVRKLSAQKFPRKKYVAVNFELNQSFEALAKLTLLFTSEFAVRPFLMRF